MSKEEIFDGGINGKGLINLDGIIERKISMTPLEKIRRGIEVDDMNMVADGYTSISGEDIKPKIKTGELIMKILRMSENNIFLVNKYVDIITNNDESEKTIDKDSFDNGDIVVDKLFPKIKTKITKKGRPKGNKKQIDENNIVEKSEATPVIDKKTANVTFITEDATEEEIEANKKIKTLPTTRKIETVKCSKCGISTPKKFFIKNNEGEEEYYCSLHHNEILLSRKPKS